MKISELLNTSLLPNDIQWLCADIDLRPLPNGGVGYKAAYVGWLIKVVPKEGQAPKIYAHRVEMGWLTKGGDDPEVSFTKDRLVEEILEFRERIKAGLAPELHDGMELP